MVSAITKISDVNADINVFLFGHCSSQPFAFNMRKSKLSSFYFMKYFDSDRDMPFQSVWFPFNLIWSKKQFLNKIFEQNDGEIRFQFQCVWWRSHFYSRLVWPLIFVGKSFWKAELTSWDHYFRALVFQIELILVCLITHLLLRFHNPQIYSQWFNVIKWMQAKEEKKVMRLI